MTPGYDSFLLVSFGGPEHASDVMPYLRRVTAGRGIPQARLDEVAQHYYAHGGASPINERCRELLGLVGPGLEDLGLACYWGNRNWGPLLEDTLAQMRDDGRSRALAFVTSAYGGYSSCRQYQEDLARAAQRVGPRAPVVDKIRLFYNHPLWVHAWAQSATEAMHNYQSSSAAAGAASLSEPDVLFSAHSIPDVAARTSPYVEHVSEAARLVARAAGISDYQLVWQSRSGSPGAPWLGPDITEVIAISEAPGFVVVPIGFVCENLEITHDLDVEAAEVAGARGKAFVRSRAVSSSASFVQMVLSLVSERLHPDSAGPRVSLGEGGPWPDLCPDGHCPAPARPAPSQSSPSPSSPSPCSPSPRSPSPSSPTPSSPTPSSPSPSRPSQAGPDRGGLA
ncbi:MAG TPA: ferrochelatase [Acidimicrobiales bacterium]|nr:ferrochelatase [Acidimicrobiales bacterium]